MTPAQQQALERAQQRLDADNAAPALTVQQQQALDRAKQRLDAETAAPAAQAPAPPDSDDGSSPLPVGDAPETEEPDGWGAVIDKSIRAGLRGTGEGLASTVDLIPMGGQYLTEVVKNVVSEASGVPYERKAVEPWITDTYNRTVAPTPKGYENVNDIAAIVGPALIESAVTLGAGAPAALAKAAARGGIKAAIGQGAKTAAKVAGRTAGTLGRDYVGSQVGGAVGQAVGGDVGRELGQFAGGVGAGSVGPRYADIRRKNAFIAPDTAERLAAAERLGITPSLGLVGTERAARSEAALGRRFGGRNAYEGTRERQAAQLDDAVREAARPFGGADAGNVNRATVGQDVRDAGNTMRRNLGSQIGGIQENLLRQVGAETAVDVGGLRRSLQSLADDPTLDARNRSLAAQQLEALDANRTAIIDPGKPPSDANLGVSYAALKDWRSKLGERSDGAPPLDRKVHDPAYAASTDAMRRAAQGKGVAPEAFDTLQARTAEHYADQPVVVSLADAATPASAYNRFSPAATGVSPDTLKTAYKYSPESVGDLMGKNLLVETRDPISGKFDPPRATTWWNKLDPESRRLFEQDPSPQAAFAPEENGATFAKNQNLSDLMTVASKERRPSKQAVPTAAETLLWPALTSATTAASAGLLGATWPVSALGLVAGPALAYARTKARLDPALPQRLLSQRPLRGETGRAAVTLGPPDSMGQIQATEDEDAKWRRLKGLPPRPRRDDGVSPMPID